MLLIVTNRHDEHADMVIESLHRKDHRFFRLNTEDFPTQNRIELHLSNQETLARVVLKLGSVSFSEVSHVWYRRPIDPVADQKIVEEQHQRLVVSETQSLLRTFWSACRHAKWVNPLDANRFAREKGTNMIAARDIGFQIPDTLFTSDPMLALNFFESHKGEVIMKPLGLVDLLVDGKKLTTYTNKLGTDFQSQTDLVQYSPVILQEYVQKEIELRVTVIGDKVFAAAIFSQETETGRIDWRQAIYNGLRYESYSLPEEISQLCLQLTKNLGLQFAAIDLILTPAGEYVFLEVNPNGQWIWLELATGQPMVEQMVRLLTT